MNIGLNLAIGNETIMKIKQMFGSKKEMEIHNNDFDQEKEETHNVQRHWDWTNLNEEERIMLDKGLHHPFYDE